MSKNVSQFSCLLKVSFWKDSSHVSLSNMYYYLPPTFLNIISACKIYKTSRKCQVK